MSSTVNQTVALKTIEQNEIGTARYAPQQIKQTPHVLKAPRASPAWVCLPTSESALLHLTARPCYRRSGVSPAPLAAAGVGVLTISREKRIF